MGVRVRELLLPAETVRLLQNLIRIDTSNPPGNEVAEKRACWRRLTLRGPGGHSSRLAPPGIALAKLGRVLTALDGARLPRHQTPAPDRMPGASAGQLSASRVESRE
jgi:hypothetical protein